MSDTDHNVSAESVDEIQMPEPESSPEIPLSSLLRTAGKSRSIREPQPRTPSPVVVSPVPAPLIIPSPSTVLQPTPPGDSTEKPSLEDIMPQSLPYNSQPDIIRRLDIVFEEREKQRQAAFQVDERARVDFFTAVKTFIEKAGEKRQTRFQYFSNHLDRHFDKLIARSKEVRATLTTEYDAAEAHRDHTFSDHETHMKTTFGDMMSLMEEHSQSLEEVQSQHMEWCYKGVDDLLVSMNAIMEKARLVFLDQFSELLRSVALTYPQMDWVDGIAEMPGSPISISVTPCDVSRSGSPTIIRHSRVHNVRVSRRRSRSGSRSLTSRSRSRSPLRVVAHEPFVSL